MIAPTIPKIAPLLKTPKYPVAKAPKIPAAYPMPFAVPKIPGVPKITVTVPPIIKPPRLRIRRVRPKKVKKKRTKAPDFVLLLCRLTKKRLLKLLKSATKW